MAPQLPMVVDRKVRWIEILLGYMECFVSAQRICSYGVTEDEIQETSTFRYTGFTKVDCFLVSRQVLTKRATGAKPIYQDNQNSSPRVLENVCGERQDVEIIDLKWSNLTHSLMSMFDDINYLTSTVNIVLSFTR